MKVKNRIENSLHKPFGFLSSDIEQFVENLFGSQCSGKTCARPEGAWAPRANVWESGTSYTIELELPGLNADDINVEIKEGRLEVSGEYKNAELEEGVKLVRNERQRGKFFRSFEFPVQVDADKVAAEFKDGVLNLVVPKSEKELPRKISINVHE